MSIGVLRINVNVDNPINISYQGQNSIVKNYSERSENELSVLLTKGDHGAFTEIYNRYWEALFMHARRMLGDDDQACDVVQDIFTNLYTKLPTIEMVSLKAYLYATVRNRILDQIRRDKLNTAYLISLAASSESDYSTVNHLEYLELEAIIEREIKLLPEKMRETFELSRQANLSYKEIAREMNTSDETVKKQISRALKRLRLKLNLLTRILLF